MPFVSEAQRRWAYTAEGTKALGGKAKVQEWADATKGEKLPEHVRTNSPYRKAYEKRQQKSK